jgi:hypothetical protein
MKVIYSLIGIAILAACSSKPTTEASADTTQAVSPDTAVAQFQQIDTSSVSNAEPTQPRVAEVKPEPKDPSKKILTCKFQRIEDEGCLHIIFDCGDFGTAETASLPADQLKLWNDLISFEGHGDFPGANPKYVDKTFEIKHNFKEGATCLASGEAGRGQVLNILSFKQITK